MLNFNRLPVKFDGSSVQFEESREFVIRQTPLQQCMEETTIYDDNRYVYQNSNIQDWINGCQVLGFIPDRQTYDISANQYCCKNLFTYQNQQSFVRSPYECYSSKQAKTTLRGNLKRKRKRTIFTAEQIVFLEGVFQRKPYITKEERVAMANTLQLSEKALKIWFQNRRRMSDKRCPEFASDSPSSVDTIDSFSDRLTFIETQIQENTDKNGYVTLNDQVMSELASVIDDYLSKDVRVSDTESLSNCTRNNNVIMYEPISPASSDFNVI